MTNGEFKWFFKAVEQATATSDVWWMGFMWLHLSKNQHKKISDLLNTKGCIKQVIKSKGNEVQTWHEMPSGLQLRRI